VYGCFDCLIPVFFSAGLDKPPVLVALPDEILGGGLAFLGLAVVDIGYRFYRFIILIIHDDI